MNIFGEQNSAKNIEEMQDEEILKASMNEPALFEVLVERYQEPLIRASYRVVRDREEAEDIVQEAFIKIYKNADKFQKVDGIEFSSWAYKITINTAITHYRRLKRSPMQTDDPEILTQVNKNKSEESLIKKIDLKTTIQKTLAKMPPHLSTVLKRYYLDDQSYETISREEKISISTLKMRLFRARKMFKKLNGDIDAL